MIGDLVSRKIHDGCARIREGMEMQFNEIIRMFNLGLKSSNPIVTSDSILDSVQRNYELGFDGPVSLHPVFEMLSVGNESYLYLVFG